MQFSVIPIRENYEFVRGFYEGLSFVRNAARKCGYIDKRGQVVIPLDYECEVSGRFVEPKFCEGFAAFVKQDKFGFVDLSGKPVIDFQYDFVSVFDDGLCLVGLRQNGDLRFGFIDKQNSTIIPCEYERLSYFSDGLAAAQKSGKLGFTDKQGNEVVPFIYEAEKSFHNQFNEELAVVAQSAGGDRIEWVCIDTAGQKIAQFSYDEVQTFRNGLVAVRNGQRYGAIDKYGNVVVPVEYERVEWSSDSLIVGVNRGVQHFYSNDGTLTVTTDYDIVSVFRDCIAIAKRGDKYYLIDVFGRELLSLGDVYDNVGLFFDGYAVVGKNGNFGCINVEGQLAIPLEYAQINAFSDGAAIAKLNDSWVILSSEL